MTGFLQCNMMVKDINMQTWLFPEKRGTYGHLRRTVFCSCQDSSSADAEKNPLSLNI
jgi:hypothetical protein